MTTPRDMMEARVNAALARYDQAIHDGTHRTQARRHMVDHILRGWDTTIEHATEAAIAERDAYRAAAELERRIALRIHPGDHAQQHTAPRRAALDQAASG